MNNWVALIIAGLFEIGFTTSMKLSQNFTSVLYTSLFLICAILSFLFLSRSLSGIPLGTAYAVWTGIGAFGTAIIGMVYFHDPVSFLRIFFLFLLIASIVGLKLAHLFS